MSGDVVRIACEAHIHAILIEGRYLRLRCTDRNCPDVIRARRHGMQVCHVYDLHTGKMWSEEEPPKARAA